MIIANWKMNGTRQSVTTWIETVSKNINIKDINPCIFCPPTCYLEYARRLIDENNYQIEIGSQIINYSFPKRYGGNIRIMLSKKFKKKKINSKILSNEEKFLKDFNNLNKKIKIWRVKKIKIINNLVSRYGALPAKAFPGRAAILIKILNLNNNHISSIYEKEGSNKIGYYAPSTKIPIISDQKLKNINKKIPIINLAWHIKKEIKSYLKKNKIYNKVLNIIDNDDFKR